MTSTNIQVFQFSSGTPAQSNLQIPFLPSKLASLWIEELTVSFSCLTAAGKQEEQQQKVD